MQPEKPIGYWIKQADELLTRGISEIHASCNLTRTGWQILNTINENPAMPKPYLAAVMAPFANAGAVEQTLTAWQQEVVVIVTQENFLTLTEKGQALHRQCFVQQQLFRQQAMTGITPEEYRITVLTLQKMAINIG